MCDMIVMLLRLPQPRKFSLKCRTMTFSFWHQINRFTLLSQFRRLIESECLFFIHNDTDRTPNHEFMVMPDAAMQTSSIFRKYISINYFVGSLFFLFIFFYFHVLFHWIMVHNNDNNRRHRRRRIIQSRII